MKKTQVIIEIKIKTLNLRLEEIHVLLDKDSTEERKQSALLRISSDMIRGKRIRSRTFT